MSHYFDCRLKGRPAGTPKSDDPNKKKRKRVARERDLCDVKIKITEFFAGATREDIQGHLNLQPRSQDLRAEHILAKVNGHIVAATQSSFDSAIGGTVVTGESSTVAIPATQRFYTIQRVNGTGACGTRVDQIRPNHKHTLEESDRIKKNSVVRWMAKPKKKLPVSGVLFIHRGIVSVYHSKQGIDSNSGVWRYTSSFLTGITIVLSMVNYLVLPLRSFICLYPLRTSIVLALQACTNSKPFFHRQIRSSSTTCVHKMSNTDPTVKEKKTYHKKATGDALNTVKKHSKDDELKLYGSCFW